MMAVGSSPPSRAGGWRSIRSSAEWRTMMADLTIGAHGELLLPHAILDRYRLAPDTPVRIIETRHGILLVPLDDAPMSASLAAELAEWQALGAESLAMFPYEDIEG